MHALTHERDSGSACAYAPPSGPITLLCDSLDPGRPSASIMSDGPPSVEGYDSADATFNEALQIDMKGLFGDTVGNVSDTRQ